MKSTQISFTILLFFGYLGNVLLLSSYFDTEQAPQENIEITSDFLIESDICADITRPLASLQEETSYRVE